MKQLKRILSIILCTVMCVSMMQTIVYAAGSEICANGHQFTTLSSYYLVSEATCTEPEYYYVGCDFCDAADFTRIVPLGTPLGHDWGKWISRGSQEHARVCKTDPSHIEREQHDIVMGTCTKCDYGIHFSDVDKKAWSYESIMYVAQHDIMKGVSATKFAPDTDTSRAMLVTILWRMAGSPIVDYKMTFKDVKENEWYTEAIRWAADLGVVNGYSATKFGPDDPITREQMMIIIARFSALSAFDTTDRADISEYKDVNNISEWAFDGVSWAVSMDLIICKNGIIDPLSIAKRDQIAYAIHKFRINVVDYYWE